MPELTAEQILELAKALTMPEEPLLPLVPAQLVPNFIAKLFPKIDESLAVAVYEYLNAYTDESGNVPWEEFIQLVEKAGTEAPEANGEDDPQVASVMEQLSAEQIDMYRDTFIRLDRNGDGYVDKNELMVGVRDCVPEARFGPLFEYLDKIFEVADKDRDARLSLTEFLCSFADGPGVVPQDVIQTLVATIRVRLTDDEIFTLQESFKRIDKNADGFIDREELFAALKELLPPRASDLTDKDFEDIVNMVLAAADRDKDDKLNLAEFIRSFQEDQGVLPAVFLQSGTEMYSAPQEKKEKRKLSKEEVAILKQAFKTLDLNNDGFVSYAEMYTALSEALDESDIGKDQVRTLVDLIMDTTERDRQSGRLTLTEFIRNFVQHEELMTIPVIAVHDRALKCVKRLREMLDSGDVARISKVFAYLDTNKDGYLDKAELHDVLQLLLKERMPDWDQSVVDEVENAIIDAADVNKDGKLSLEEFLHSFAADMDVLPLDIVNEWGEQLRRHLSPEELEIVRQTFMAMDTNHDGFVSRQELQDALSSALGEAIEDEAHLKRIADFVLEKVDENHDGKISLKEFVGSFERDQGVLPLVTKMEPTKYEKSVIEIAELLHVRHIIQLAQVFAILNADRDELFPAESLHNVLQQLFKNHLPDWDKTALEELEKIVVKATDITDAGLLSVREFLNAWEEFYASPAARAARSVQKLNDMMERGDLVRISKVFTTLDTNQDGYLDKGELHGVMVALLKDRFPEWDDDTIAEVENAIVDASDVNDDGKLSLHEFIASFANGIGVLPEEVVLEWGANIRRKLSPEEQEIVKKTFVAMDSDHDGFISPEELHNALSSALAQSTEDQERLRYVAACVLDLVDDDKDGMISLREFILSFEKDQGVLPVVIERPEAPVAREMEAHPETPVQQPPPVQPEPVDHTKPLPQLVTSPHPGASATPASPYRNDVSGVAVGEDQLLSLFQSFDKNHDGALSRLEFKKSYMEMEWFGLEPSQEEVDRLFSKYGGAQSKICFDEFCLLMSRRARM